MAPVVHVTSGDSSEDDRVSSRYRKLVVEGYGVGGGWGEEEREGLQPTPPRVSRRCRTSNNKTRAEQRGGRKTP